MQLVLVLAQRVERVRSYLAEHPINLPILIDRDRAVAKRYGVWHRIGFDALNIARPAVFVIDPNRRIQAIYVGESQGEFPSDDDLRRELHSL